MSKFILSALLMCAVTGMVFADSDSGNKAIGYVLENHAFTDVETDAPRTSITVIRNGHEVQAFEGDEVFPGDVLKTSTAGDMTVAFIDQSAVRMLGDTEIKINSAASTIGMNGATVVQGHASVAFQGESATPRSLNVGVSDRATKPVSATGPAKLDILVNKDSAGNFVTTVGVLKGVAVLTPADATRTNIAAGGIAVLSVPTPVAGVTPGGAPVTISQGNLTKDQIKALHTSAVTETFVSTTKTGATIKSRIVNSDGSVVSVSETLVNGVVTKDASSTVDVASKKKIDTWSESTTKVSFTRVFDGYSIKSSGTKGAPGKGTVKGPNKTSYTGVTTVNSSTGVITFTTTVPNKKDGSSVSYSFNPNTPNGGEQTIILIPKTGPAGETIVDFNKATGVRTTTSSTGTIVNGQYVADPSSIKTTVQQMDKNPAPQKTPDGHVVDQDSPPVSQ